MTITTPPGSTLPAEGMKATRQTSTAGTTEGSCVEGYCGCTESFDVMEVEVRGRTVHLQCDWVLCAVLMMVNSIVHLSKPTEGTKTQSHLTLQMHTPPHVIHMDPSGEGGADSTEDHTHAGQRAHKKSWTFHFCYESKTTLKQKRYNLNNSCTYNK